MQFKSPIFLGAVMIMGAFASPVPHHPRHHPRDAAGEFLPIFRHG